MESRARERHLPERALRPTALAWYFGIPGAGKTTLATRHSAELVRITGWPVLVVNTEEVDQLAGIPDAGSPRRAIERVWNEGQHASFVPESQEDVDFVLHEARRRKNVILFIDEAACWINAHDRHSIMLRLMRAHRHSHVAMVLTTQHMSGDCPQEALSCAPVLYVFNCTSEAVLERLWKRYKIPPEAVESLPRGKYFRIKSGFPDREAGQV